MKLKLLFFASGLFCYIYTFGQLQEKLFYDNDWNGCVENKASYYRLVTYNSEGNPIGIVRDYYITGEIQSEGEAILIGKGKDSDSRWKNKLKIYYKSGKISGERNYNEFGFPEGIDISWYENGNKELEAFYKNGKLTRHTEYYESGKEKYIFSYLDGKLNVWYLECDEFGKCHEVFYESFEDNENINNWPIAYEGDCNIKIEPNKGMKISSPNELSGCSSWINIPINFTKNFSIETSCKFVSGSRDNIYGLIFGFKDWDNYHYFFITVEGSYRLGNYSDGIHFKISEKNRSPYINTGIGENVIKMIKIGDKMFYSINSELIANANLYSFRGNNTGFVVDGNQEVLFEYLRVTKDVDINLPETKSNSQKEWTGNGTGFFIDSRGYIATNYHVVENASAIEVEFIQNGQKKSFSAKVIVSDKQNDLAIIKIETSEFKPFTKLPYNFKSQISDVGSNVFALGYPMALSIMGEEIKFTDGKISSRTGYQGEISTYQISVPVQPGNSGGPLFDSSGNVIGIVNAKIMAADNVSYAIKTSYLTNLIEVMPESLNLPNDNSISTKSLTEKIKVLTDYVVMIKIK